MSNTFMTYADRKQIAELTVAGVMSVYSGRPGRCCCGCSGKHYYASTGRAEASKHRGYAVDDDEISDRMIKKVLNIVQRELHALGDVEHFGSGASVTIDNRLYCVYFKEA